MNESVAGPDADPAFSTGSDGCCTSFESVLGLGVRCGTWGCARTGASSAFTVREADVNPYAERVVFARRGRTQLVSQKERFLSTISDEPDVLVFLTRPLELVSAWCTRFVTFVCPLPFPGMLLSFSSSSFWRSVDWRRASFSSSIKRLVSVVCDVISLF